MLVDSATNTTQSNSTGNSTQGESNSTFVDPHSYMLFVNTYLFFFVFQIFFCCGMKWYSTRKIRAAENKFETEKADFY